MSRNFPKLLLQPRRGRGGAGGPGGRSTETDFSPTSWSKYFDDRRYVELEEGRFHYYSKGSHGPLLLTLHGGGYSGLTWALFAAEVSKKIECQIIAVDMRGHGNTKANDEDNMSLERLAGDIVDLIKKIFPTDRPPIVLIGHSLGGAVAVEVSRRLSNVTGVVVIDVVEGTALESLAAMQSVLHNRPEGFQSIMSAIKWGGGSTHNAEAAKVSMPGQIINIATGELAAEECGLVVLEEAAGTSHDVKDLNSIAEVHHESDEAVECCDEIVKSLLDNFKSPKTKANAYTWRIDLSRTECFWPGWFTGLSEKFLHIPVPKILILANLHGLDTTLTVGQMQGKFQLQVLARSGHAVHEDQPDSVADIVATYLVRQKLTKALAGFVPMVPGC